MATASAPYQPTLVAGIEARGFIFGAGIAHQLGLGFVPVRKSKKLPGAVIGIDYELEYGVDRLEIHNDVLGPDDRVLIIDDLIATGGTATATVNRSEEHTSELQSLMRTSYAVFCLKKTQI